MKNISLYTNSSNVINGTDFLAMIYSVDDMEPKEQLKKGISAIDLGNCTKIIKDYYNISQEESFLVLNIESKKNQTKKNNNNDNSFDLGKNIHIEIYDFSGRKLNLSICQENIRIMEYLNDIEELDIQSSKNYALQGIDVFNAKDNFFNDLCYYYDNNEEKDIIINDRRNDIYQNVSFCQYGCFYDGVDYELMPANCICNSNAFQDEDDINNIKKNKTTKDEKINFNTIKTTFLSNLFDFNFNVLKCYNLVINLKILKRNFGFYFMSVMILLQIIFLIIYLINGLKSIKSYMIIHRPRNKKKDSFASIQQNIVNLKNSKKINIKKEININKGIKHNLKKIILNKAPKRIK